MAGIYIHIPFCSRFCSYCDFFKSARVDLIPVYLKALIIELKRKRQFLGDEWIETIYLGGGTPSLLDPGVLAGLFREISGLYNVQDDCEITMELNPDDLTSNYLRDLAMYTPVNRLSIGVQSFDDETLRFLNRRHTGRQAFESIQIAGDSGFKNTGIDLIYGLPLMELDWWKSELTVALGSGIRHLSAYQLSIEPNTALGRLHKRGMLTIAGEDRVADQFFLLSEVANQYGFQHYEISNLAPEGYHSRHNTNYWLQRKYLGAGAGAHSYNGHNRYWNPKDIRGYIAGMESGEPVNDQEVLTESDQFNEFVMLRLRMSEGLPLQLTRALFGNEVVRSIQSRMQAFIQTGHVLQTGEDIRLTHAGWMISDYIIRKLLNG